MSRNGEFFAMSENFAERDKLTNLIGEAQDCFSDDGETIRDDALEIASELINESLPDALNQFAAPYCYFGAHCGDGADFGFWPNDIEEIKESVGFASSVDQDEPDTDYVGEWLHINERGNCVLYVRENGQDKEIWSIV